MGSPLRRTVALDAVPCGVDVLAVRTPEPDHGKREVVPVRLRAPGALQRRQRPQVGPRHSEVGELVRDRLQRVDGLLQPEVVPVRQVDAAIASSDAIVEGHTDELGRQIGRVVTDEGRNVGPRRAHEVGGR
eukprot:CAMPEP_0172537438 /NCGR_PEP_ID=MMETSP1067-20121228/9040_1 /TAXON_ID=265564 ORGANISM="Thalassiosira punctigera, Strain Tpunct2005C2" /NCGR_SAMPLE_ID=MMETSP1067 /ASSEMBLY_ACC=CAM_ASM_000444 /LENGTH=130 /DNA_ID=CAMNT_0013322741 /DNA_START=48 /DNA_END=436 /DNA_ORIENTATION=-